MSAHAFAYLFERFPSFVQTFVYREAVEMARQGMNPWPVSIRRPKDSHALATQPELEVYYLPEEKEVRRQGKALHTDRKLPFRARRALQRHWNQPDSQRIFEAIWLAPLLRQRSIRHVHAQFGGIASRTAWWLREIFGFSYSFTGHANDIFCETEFFISNADLVRNAAFVVVVTDYARRWMEQKYPWARGRVFRVFNGIEFDTFLPAKPASDGVPRILSVGRYVEKKGFGDLIEACRLLRDRGAVFECLIAGGGPLEADLQTRIDRAQLSPTVRLLGPRAQDEVRRLLAEAQIFALACVPEAGGGSDNLPTVIMEAMASSLPVVSTRIAGVPEMIDDGVDGLLVSAQAPAELAAALEKLLAAPSLRERLGAAGRLSAREKFRIEATVSQLKKLLHRHAWVFPPGSAFAWIGRQLNRLRW